MMALYVGHLVDVYYFCFVSLIGLAKKYLLKKHLEENLENKPPTKSRKPGIGLPTS